MHIFIKPQGIKTNLILCHWHAIKQRRMENCTYLMKGCMYKKVFRCMKVISLKETRDVELRGTVLSKKL